MNNLRSAAACASGVAMVAVLVRVIYLHFVVHPEWTRPQALRELWPLYVALAVLYSAVMLLMKEKL